MRKIIFILAVTVLILSEMLIASAKAEYVICDPTSSVNVHYTPEKKGIVCGYFECGNEVILDGKKKGDWVHVVNVSGEWDEGWIHKGYITAGPIVIETCDGYAYKKVHVRNNVGGKIKTTLKQGEPITVYAYSLDYDGWAVTNKGYIMARYIDDGLGGN